MLPSAGEDRRLSRVRFRWSVEGEAGGAVFSAPDGSHAFGIDLEEGMPTRRTKGLSRISIVWRTKSNRLARKTIYLPAGATDVEAHYDYLADGPPAQDAREGPPLEAEAVKEEVPSAEAEAAEEVPAAAEAVQEVPLAAAQAVDVQISFGDPSEIARLYGIRPPGGAPLHSHGRPTRPPRPPSATRDEDARRGGLRLRL